MLSKVPPLPLQVNGQTSLGADVRHLPSAQSWGNAGRSFTLCEELCSSIAEIPATPPKLPSIRKGGWLSNWAAWNGPAAVGRSLPPLPISQGSPEIDDPRPAPTGVTTSMRKSPFQCLFRAASASWGVSSGVIRCPDTGKKMGNMAVSHFHLRVFLQPLLQSSIGSDLLASADP